MFEVIFDLPAGAQLAVFVVHGALVFGASFGLMYLVHTRTRHPDQWMPVAGFFMAISVIFALFLAFHASDIWLHRRDAERAFIQGGSAVKRLDELTGPAQLNAPDARAAVRRYVVAVRDDEWGRSRNHSQSERAEQAFRDLQLAIMRLIPTVPGPTGGQLYALLNDFARYRSDRLWIGRNHTDFSSWLGVLILGFLTHISVASVHFDRLRAGVVALLLTALATTLAYWTLGVVDDPYRNSDLLNPAAWLSDKN